MKTELQEKNSQLSDALTKAREDLKSMERDHTLLEDEKRRLQTQLTNVQHQASSNETALQMANQVINDIVVLDFTMLLLLELVLLFLLI